MVLLFHAKPGEDSAYANYKHARALMCANNPSDAARIISEFTSAVDIGLADQTTSCNEWSKIVVYKSLIQQAVFLLDSNKKEGIADENRQENITKASFSLLKLKLNIHSLSKRIKCLYHLAESELLTQKKEVDGANKAAREAQTIAAECGFAHLLHSAMLKSNF